MSEIPSTPDPDPEAGQARSFAERLIGAVRLDAAVYDEIEHDPSALPQAAGVIALAAVAVAIGNPGVAGPGGAIAGVVSAFVGWLASTAVIWLVGVRWLKHSSDYPELLRTVGFASAPQILMVLGVIGTLAPLAAGVAGIWQLVAYVVAVRQALDVTTGRAIVVCLLAVLVSFLVIFVLSLFGTCATR